MPKRRSLPTAADRCLKSNLNDPTQTEPPTTQSTIPRIPKPKHKCTTTQNPRPLSG